MLHTLILIAISDTNYLKLTELELEQLLPLVFEGYNQQKPEINPIINKLNHLIIISKGIPHLQSKFFGRDYLLDGCLKREILLEL